MSSGVRAIVVMDPIESINPAKDTTLGILLAAQASGWEIFYAELGDLWLLDGVAWGRLAPLEVFDDPRTWFSRGARVAAKLRPSTPSTFTAPTSSNGLACKVLWSATIRRAFET
jgi:glutathione synthase/RimK-type ligase-like ATP-grasp enzyme